MNPRNDVSSGFASGPIRRLACAVCWAAPGRFLRGALLFGGLLLGGLLARGSALQQDDESSLRRCESRHLPNAIWVHPTVMSGGMPTGPEAFEELKRLGIRTVISVDGIKPDVESALSEGLRYVHLPHGYEGISDTRLKEIAKAVRDLPGPVYIHCHHGKHRSPAASAAACIALGKIPASQGMALLRLAGTNFGFRGLVRAVEEAAPMSPSDLDALNVEFVPVAEVPPLVDAMVAMDSIFERLKELQQSDWFAPKEQRAPEALMLKEHYMELHRSETRNQREPEFLEWLEHSRALAELLELRLSRDANPLPPEDVAAASSLMKQLSNDCAQCHAHYRNNR